MNSKDWNKLLAPFSRLVNKAALSQVYKALEISANTIRGCAPWGVLEVDVALEGVPETFWIDATNFIAVMKSLPDGEVVLTIKNGGLAWECGLAEGKLATLAPVEIPGVDWGIFKKKLWTPTKDFIEVLQLGALSCGPMSMASAGVYGVSIDPFDGGVNIASSDNVTMSTATLEDPNFPTGVPRLALVPDALEMLISVLKHKDDKTKASLSEKAIYVKAGPFRLMLKPAPTLKHDIVELCARYADRNAVLEIPGDRIKAFVQRASALAESKQHTYVTLRVGSGAMGLSFSEGAATTDEYYMAKGVEDIPDLPEIKLDAARVARVLTHAGTMALDHVEQGVVVFFGESPAFSYLVCGSQTVAQ